MQFRRKLYKGKNMQFTESIHNILLHFLDLQIDQLVLWMLIVRVYPELKHNGPTGDIMDIVQSYQLVH